MSGAEEVSIEEIKEKYKHQWVLVEVFEEVYLDHIRARLEYTLTVNRYRLWRFL